mmetsp:Transcript_13326/g.26331  ORF Transcript_13326/g.26331 Transcript_13326/m.26331 type:complete len:133 (-) Transcript_13326:70-468(-)
MEFASTVSQTDRQTIGGMGGKIADSCHLSIRAQAAPSSSFSLFPGFFFLLCDSMSRKGEFQRSTCGALGVMDAAEGGGWRGVAKGRAQVFFAGRQYTRSLFSSQLAVHIWKSVIDHCLLCAAAVAKHVSIIT